MPFRKKTERQLHLEDDSNDENDAAPPVKESSDEMFHSELNDDSGNEATPRWPETFAELQQMLKLKISDIDEQTGRMEKLREVKWHCDAERCDLQQHVDCKTTEAECLRAKVEEARQPAVGSNSGNFGALFMQLCACEQQLKHLQRQRDHACHEFCRANACFNRETEDRQSKFEDLQQLARQHNQLAKKIKSDPQQRQKKEHLEKTNEAWDAIKWPRPPRPATIVANAIARQIDGETSGRRVYLIRNAERVQDVFPNWINECFIGEQLYYVIGDANQPRAIPERRKHPDDFHHDPPISEMGREHAIIVGASLAMRDQEREFYFVTSPSLYCLQTAMAIKQGACLEADSSIVVEPGLFQDFHLEVNDDGTTVAPNFLNAADFKSLGFEYGSIDSTYRQSTSLQAIKTLIAHGETPASRSSRLASAVAHAVTQAPANASVVIVGHPATLQAVDSYLGPRQPMPETSMAKDLLGLQYPYLSVVGFQEKNGRWKRIIRPLPPFNYGSLTNEINVLNN